MWFDMSTPDITENVSLGLFVSNYTHSLDPKRRLTIPSDWRTKVGDPPSLYVLPDIHEKCLCAFPAREMIHRLERIRKHSLADRSARSFARALAAQSELVAWDAQGRIRIKDELLAYAGIKDKVALVGAFDSFELWNPATLRRAGGMDREKLQDIAEYVGF
jgi:MraZ protein